MKVELRWLDYAVNKILRSGHLFTQKDCFELSWAKPLFNSLNQPINKALYKPFFLKNKEKYIIYAAILALNLEQDTMPNLRFFPQCL